jgi:hypothetical protein
MYIDWQELKVPRDAYFLIDVEWTHGFKHVIACRGYNLKSWLDFEERLGKFNIKKVTYKEVTNKVWEKKRAS